MSDLDPEVMAELARIKEQRKARENRAKGGLTVVNSDRRELRSRGGTAA